MRPFTLRLAGMIGRREFEQAIAEMRAGLRGNSSDQATLEMIASCLHWSGQTDEAIAACYGALRYDPNAFDMHAMLAQLLADKGEHEQAAVHVRKGLEWFPEPVPKAPAALNSVFTWLGRIVPRLRGLDPNGALRSFEAQRAQWFEWAKQYLIWYDEAFGESTNPKKH